MEEEIRKVFDFEQGQNVAEITLEELSHSRNVVSSSGKSFTNRPEHAAMMLKRIHGTLNELGLVFTQEPIIITRGNSQKDFPLQETIRPGFDVDAPVPFSRWIFHKLITRIIIPTEIPPRHDGIIAVAYNQGGIQIAFGLNYQVCHNMCILGGDRLIFNTGSSSIGQQRDYWEMIEMIRLYLKNINQVFSVSAGIIKAMQKKKVDVLNDFIELMVGKLYIMMIKSQKGERRIPFAKDDLYRFVKDLASAIEKNKVNNVYDLYNIGTQIIIPEYVGLENILIANKLWGEFLIQAYNIPSAPLEINGAESISR